MSENIKHGTDALAAVLTGLSITMTWMPQIAALFAVIWYCIRIYDYFKPKKAEDE